MPESELSPAAQIAKKRCYALFVSALFVSSERREALFGLIAFNSEINRILHTLQEPALIPLRLQWWREVLVTKDEKNHEILPSLQDGFRKNYFNPDDLVALIDKKEAKQEGASLMGQSSITAAQLQDEAFYALVFRILGVTESLAMKMAEQYLGTVPIMSFGDFKKFVVIKNKENPDLALVPWRDVRHILLERVLLQPSHPLQRSCAIVKHLLFSMMVKA